MRTPLLLLALGAAACGAKGPPFDDPALRREIEPWLDDGRPVLVSPDGARILHKVETPDRQSELRVFERKTNEARGVLPGGWPLLLTWRPDDGALAFVTDDGGDQKMVLRLWTPPAATSVPLDAPVGRNADRFMQWSPDGRRLALFVDPDDESAGKQLRVLDLGGSAPPAVVPLKSVTDFRWSPDGARLALLSSEFPGVIRFLSPNGNDAGTVHAPAAAGARRFVWHADGRRLVMAGRGARVGTSTLIEVDARTGRHRALVAGDGTIDSPVTLPDGGVLYHLDLGGQRRLLRLRDGGGAEPVGFDEGHASWMATEANGRTVYVDHIGLVRPRGLYRVALDAPRPPERVAGQLGYQDIQGTPPEFVTLKTAGGEEFPAYLRRAQTAGPTRGVLIKVPIANVKAGRAQFEGINEFVIRKGYDVLTLSRNGDADGSATDEGERERAVVRVLAAIDYVRERLGARTETTALYGSSYGASICVLAAGRAPDRIGGLVLQGLTPFARQAAPVPTRMNVAAFQGEKDPFGTDAAHAILEKTFGAALWSSRRGSLETLLSEGHGVRRRASQARIGTAMVKVLQAGGKR